MPDTTHLIRNVGARVLDKIPLRVGHGSSWAAAALLNQDLAILVEPLQLVSDAADLKIDLL